MFCKKISCLLVIFLACHNVKGNPHTSLVLHLHEIFNQLLEDIEILRDSDIIHSLRLIKAKSGTLSPCQKNCTNLSCTQCLNPDSSKFLSSIFNFRKFCSPKRFKHPPFLSSPMHIIRIGPVHLQKLLLQSRRNFFSDKLSQISLIRLSYLLFYLCIHSDTPPYTLW